jgi:putative transcription factor
MDCEVCGAPDATIIAIVEGVKMRICNKCAKYASRIISREQPEEKKTTKSRGPEKEFELVEDYAQRIKNAREKKGINRSDFAAAMNIKESFLRRIEDGELVPDDDLIKKLSTALGIELLEEVEVSSQKVETKKSSGLTLGDVVELKKKSKK